MIASESNSELALTKGGLPTIRALPSLGAGTEQYRVVFLTHSRQFGEELTAPVRDAVNDRPEIGEESLEACGFPLRPESAPLSLCGFRERVLLPEARLLARPWASASGDCPATQKECLRERIPVRLL
jgi:hypothetical protein